MNKVYIVFLLYCDEIKRRYMYNSKLGKRICGVAESLELAEQLIFEYRKHYLAEISIGYRIEERELNKVDSEDIWFDYDVKGNKLIESDFKIGDPVDVIHRQQICLGVISDIVDNDKDRKYCIATHHTSPTSFYCCISNIRKPDFLITEDDVKKIKQIGRVGVAWQKCQEANVLKAKEILSSLTDKLGNGITITSNNAYSPETTFTISVPDYPKKGWTVRIDMTTNKILQDRRKVYVTLRTILKLPTNGKRYSYKKAVLTYKSEIQYAIL